VKERNFGNSLYNDITVVQPPDTTDVFCFLFLLWMAGFIERKEKKRKAMI